MTAGGDHRLAPPFAADGDEPHHEYDGDQGERSGIAPEQPRQIAETAGDENSEARAELAIVRESAAVDEVECRERGMTDRPGDDRVSELVHERDESGEESA